MKLKVSPNVIFIPFLIALIWIASMNNFQASTAEVHDRKHYFIASGNSGGTYYFIGAGQSKILSEELEISVSTQSTGGSPVENMTLVSRDSQGLGIVTIDGYHAGRTGDQEKGFTDALDNVEVLMMGHKAYLYCITMDSSQITEYKQLIGKKIAVPSAGSTTYYMALAVLEAYGCTEENSKIIPLSSSEQADALKDGVIDAAFLAGGISQATVMDLDYSNEIHFLSIDKSVQKSLDIKYPYWHSSVIPNGTYTKQERDINCLTVTTMLVCNQEMDQDAAYNITKTLNRRTDELGDIHSSGYEWNLDSTRAYLDNDMLTFHPGALQYYGETEYDDK